MRLPSTNRRGPRGDLATRYIGVPRYIGVLPPRVRPLRWSLALVTVPTRPLGPQTCTYGGRTIYFNPLAHSGYVTDDGNYH